MGACVFTRASGSLADEAESVYEGFRVVRGTLTLSASYATGGDTIPLGSVGLQEIRRLLLDASLAVAAFGHTSGLSVQLGGTPSVPTLIAFDANGTEVPNATNLSARNPQGVWLLGFG